MSTQPDPAATGATTAAPATNVAGSTSIKPGAAAKNPALPAGIPAPMTRQTSGAPSSPAGSPGTPGGSRLAPSASGSSASGGPRPGVPGRPAGFARKPTGTPTGMGPRTSSSASSNAMGLDSAPKDISLGSVRVGHGGITFSGGSSSSLDAAADASASSPTLPPMVSIDDLVFIKELGKGAAGSVNLYRHKDTKEKYAVKKVNVSGKQQAMSLVAAEIRNVFVAPSPHAVQLLNAFYRDQNLLLVMEYMDGGNLGELLEKQPKLPEAAASYVAYALFSALNHLHRKHQVVDAKNEKRQIHRDIKPDNMMLSRSGAVKVADFGVAGSADSIGLASFVGTATYMSPERIKGERYGTPSDVWSAGIVVAQVLKGEYPFKAAGGGFMALLKEVTSFTRVDLNGVSDEAQDFIALCLKQKEEDRATAEKLLQHPWILKYNDPDNLVGQKEFSDVIRMVYPGRQSSTSSVAKEGANGKDGSASEPATPTASATATASGPAAAAAP